MRVWFYVRSYPFHTVLFTVLTYKGDGVTPAGNIEVTGNTGTLAKTYHLNHIVAADMIGTLMCQWSVMLFGSPFCAGGRLIPLANFLTPVEYS